MTSLTWMSTMEICSRAWWCVYPEPSAGPPLAYILTHGACRLSWKLAIDAVSLLPYNWLALVSERGSLFERIMWQTASRLGRTTRCKCRRAHSYECSFYLFSFHYPATACVALRPLACQVQQGSTARELPCPEVPMFGLPLQLPHPTSTCCGNSRFAAGCI